MLKCRDIAEQATHYIEGNDPWYRKLSWHLHMIMCGPCKRFVSHLKLTINVSRSMSKHKMPKADSQALADRIKDSCNHNSQQH